MGCSSRDSSTPLLPSPPTTEIPLMCPTLKPIISINDTAYKLWQIARKRLCQECYSLQISTFCKHLTIYISRTYFNKKRFEVMLQLQSFKIPLSEYSPGTDLNSKNTMKTKISGILLQQTIKLRFSNIHQYLSLCTGSYSLFYLPERFFLPQCLFQSWLTTVNTTMVVMLWTYRVVYSFQS